MAHPTVPVRAGNREAGIDALIAPLIRALWERGIDTYSCCQGGSERTYEQRVWIAFRHVRDGERWLRGILVRSADKDSLYQRVRRAGALMQHDPLAWYFAVHVEDSGEWDSRVPRVPLPFPASYEDSAGLRFSLSVWFPRSDLDEVIRRTSEMPV